MSNSEQQELDIGYVVFHHPESILSTDTYSLSGPSGKELCSSTNPFACLALHYMVPTSPITAESLNRAVCQVYLRPTLKLKPEFYYDQITYNKYFNAIREEPENVDPLYTFRLTTRKLKEEGLTPHDIHDKQSLVRNKSYECFRQFLSLILPVCEFSRLDDPDEARSMIWHIYSRYVFGGRDIFEQVPDISSEELNYLWFKEPKTYDELRDKLEDIWSKHSQLLVQRFIHMFLLMDQVLVAQPLKLTDKYQYSLRHTWFPVDNYYKGVYIPIIFDGFYYFIF